jgi:hypothetical protein
MMRFIADSSPPIEKLRHHAAGAVEGQGTDR